MQEHWLSVSTQEEQEHPKVFLLFFSVHITTEKRKDMVPK
jgi:hypothetical protein